MNDLDSLSVTRSPWAENIEGPIDILVIDDDRFVRNVIVSILDRCGYSWLSAPDGESAMKLMKQRKFRLVITDIFMPGMDGLELIMKYTRSNPEALILAISGGGKFTEPHETLKPARVLGSHRTLAKPFDLDDFVLVLKEMLGPKA
jgi:DNA-binding NtrC family response regulator